jgi:poly-gamma-glutamate capsule biosynthesis protein CapA/YwtB (metallophosphatase superfamily)
MANKSSANGEVTILAVADVNPNETDELNRLAGSEPLTASQRFDLVRSILASGDITFGQLEQPLSTPAESAQIFGNDNFARGTKPTDPRAGARVLADAGFDVMSFASNHVMDFGEKGLLESIDAVAETTDVKLIGSGRTIDDARAPAIFERNGVRIGFLAYCTVLMRNHWAGTEVSSRSGAVSERAGCAPLRAHSSFEAADWQPGAQARVVTSCYPEDLEAMVDDIKKLREQVDVVVVSQHWGVHREPGTIAMYQVEGGHAAIDAGADVILGHHPHLLKGIEFYKGKPIVYAMANFNTAVRGHGGAAFVGVGETHDSQKTCITKVIIKDGKIDRISLIPCFLENTRLQPEPLTADDPRAEQIRKYMEWVCAHNTPHQKGIRQNFGPFETDLTFDGDEIVVTPR